MLNAQGQRRSTDSDNEEGGNFIHLIATGIGSLEELTFKYKDTPFILQCSRKQKQEHTPSLSVSIQHGVNVIASLGGSDHNSSSEDPSSITKSLTGGDDTSHDLYGIADHVIFHHPHLGTEDAALHARFLAHLFYSATVHWMKPGVGVFHLTLAQGQSERWRCLEAANLHGPKLPHHR